ncbi:unnamed protein product, partial [marine sediment metagenome]
MSEKTEQIKTMIVGLEANRDELIGFRDVFLKVQGLDEQVEKERQKLGELEVDVEAAKETMSGYQEQKRDAIRATMVQITRKMSAVLPTGDGCIQIEDNSIQIGWFKDGVFRPYDGLSGSEA